MKSRSEISAGGVVFRRSPVGIEILICKAASYHRWVLPKGLVDKGEKLEQTALREVREEVGVRARLIDNLGEPEQYIFTFRGVRIFKKVYYFLMEYEQGSEQIHDHEMEEVKWVPIDDALTLLAYEGSREMVRRAKARLDGTQTDS
jgi:8-oxo-dGTP pyrophosphatase MutT (NUDIX family)